MAYCTELCPKRQDRTASCALCKSLADRDAFCKGEFLKMPFVWLFDCLGYLGAAHPIVFALFLFVVMSFGVGSVTFRHFYVRQLDNFWEGVLVESFGMLFDIFILLLGVRILEYFGEKRRQIARYKDEIQYLLGLQSDEARHRLQGLIRRLNDLGVTNLSLEKAYLVGADLWNANLTGASLKGACLEEANLHFANLTDADLSSANLKGANLMQANVSGTNLKHTNLRGTDFSSASYMTQEQFEDIGHDKHTKTPSHIRRPERSLLYVDECEPDGNRVVPIRVQLKELSQKMDEILDRLPPRDE